MTAWGGGLHFPLHLTKPVWPIRRYTLGTLNFKQRTDKRYPYGSNQRSLSPSVPSLSMAEGEWSGDTVTLGLVYRGGSFGAFPGFRAWLPESEALPLF